MGRQQSEMASLIAKYSKDVLDYGSRYNVDVTLLLLNASKGLDTLTSSTFPVEVPNMQRATVSKPLDFQDIFSPERLTTQHTY